MKLISEADVTVKLAVLHILFLDVVRVFVKQLSYLLHGAAMRADKRNQLTDKLVVSRVFMHILTALRWYLYAEALIFCGDLYLTYGVLRRWIITREAEIYREIALAVATPAAAI